MIKKILLDMDDVLCSCSDDIMRHMGLSEWIREDYTREDRDIVEMYYEKTDISYSTPVFWEHFKREFWANIRHTPWCFDLINLCCEFVPQDQIAICTSPTKCGDSLAGKLDWISDNMPPWLHRQYIMTPRKEFCATDGAVLIDDAEVNTDAFIEAGGDIILVPQPWNRNRGKLGEELSYIHDELTRIAEREDW